MAYLAVCGTELAMVDNRWMVGPASSMADVPLGYVLPGAFLDSEGELRRLAYSLDSHPAAHQRSAWHWYPGRTQPPDALGDRVYQSLVDTTITLFNAGADSLELTLDIAWRDPATLTVNAAIEVACWCTQDHNIHRVRDERWPVLDSKDLADAFAAGTAMLSAVLTSGPFEPRAWRARAGLPERPNIAP